MNPRTLHREPSSGSLELALPQRLPWCSDTSVAGCDLREDLWEDMVQGGAASADATVRGCRLLLGLHYPGLLQEPSLEGLSLPPSLERGPCWEVSVGGCSECLGQTSALCWCPLRLGVSWAHGDVPAPQQGGCVPITGCQVGLPC